MKPYLSLFAVCVFAVLAAPAASHAYDTTEQAVTRYNETTALFSVTYTFGASAYDFYLPAFATRGADTNEVVTLNYELLIDGETKTDAGNTVGVVFSNAEVVNGEYFVPAGTKAEFTLMTILSTAADEAEADYALKVTSLPFNEVRDSTDVENALTGSELADYQTPEIELNDDSAPEIKISRQPQPSGSLQLSF